MAALLPPEWYRNVIFGVLQLAHGLQQPLKIEEVFFAVVA